MYERDERDERKKKRRDYQEVWELEAEVLVSIVEKSAYGRGR